MALQAMDSFPPAESQWGELAPYLAGLNVSEALEDFGRLADRVLSPAPNKHHQAAADPLSRQLAPATATFDEHRYQLHYTNSVYSSSSSPLSSCLIDESVVSPSSPGGASLYSTATTSATQSSSVSSHWSQPPSPVTSENSLSCGSSAFSSPSYSYSYSSSSSAASSVCGDLEQRKERRLSRRSSSGVSKRGDRRRQNASAADRYRKKQRGRQCDLDGELEQERQRNAKLMQSFEAKLELYREFANLLASNTRDPSRDLDLAKLGSSSLENILERICPAQFLAQNERQRSELERLHDHFRRVLSVAQFQL